MNGRVVKQIRNNMYYPKKRTYTRDENGVIHADAARKDYQKAKKAHYNK